jgi:hypothetical protein
VISWFQHLLCKFNLYRYNAANTVVGASFLPMVSGIGLKGTYAVYAVLCFAGYVFVDNLVFETKAGELYKLNRVDLHSFKAPGINT